jgi:hypothetical protein
VHRDFFSAQSHRTEGNSFGIMEVWNDGTEDKKAKWLRVLQYSNTPSLQYSVSLVRWAVRI